MARSPTTASPPRAGARGGSRLTVDDWIDAGLTLIAQEGTAGGEDRPPVQRLGVTKGSFYWHFSDIQGYLDALAEAWATEQRSSQASLEALRELRARGAPRRA